MYVSSQDNHIVKQYSDENIQRILFEFLIVRINGNSEKYNFFRIMLRQAINIGAIGDVLLSK